MLEEIKIKNFALIKDLSIRFTSGLNILTGETGAGKSIIIDALGAILGEKVTTAMIRSGEEKAIVEGSFILEPNTEAEKLLDRMGVEVEGRYVNIRREFSSEGRGRSFINGVMLPSSKIRDVGLLLVDIHGQNEHQAILKVQNHLNILDFMGAGDDLWKKREVFENDHKKWQGLREKLKSLEINSQEREDRIELLNFAIDEIEESDFKSGEEEVLKSEAKRLAGSEKLFAELKEAYALFFGSEDESSGILDLLSKAEKVLSNAVETDDRLHPVFVQVQESYFRAQDAAKSISNHSDQIEFSPERLNEVEERLDALQKLYKKYKVVSINELNEYLAKARKELESINLGEENIKKTRDEIKRLETELTAQAVFLSKLRAKVALELEDLMNRELKDLVMENTRFQVHILQQEDDEESPINVDGKKMKCYRHGMDYVEYYIAAGSNEKMRPLRKIASGGEMSRLMLALKKLIIEKVEPQSMVFDEVDSGVGGRVAERIGKKLKILSKSGQTICITHLPQIAAMADIQFKVMKVKDVDERVITTVKRLTRKERIVEIARMMSGEEITDVTLQHAQEMLDMAYI